MTLRRLSATLLFPAALLVSSFLVFGCDDDNYYEPDLSTVPEARDTTGVQRIEKSNGLVIYVHEEGEGSFSVTERDLILARYTGRLTDGGIFMSSWIDGRSQPVQLDLHPGASGFPDIQGFTRGVTGLKEGSKVTLVIPPTLAYGQQARQMSYGFVTIPSNSTLVFDVDVVSIFD